MKCFDLWMLLGLLSDVMAKLSVASNLLVLKISHQDEPAAVLGINVKVAVRPANGEVTHF